MLMYVVNCVVSWIIVIVAVTAYYYIRRKTGQRWLFWPLLAAGYTFFAVTHSLILAGVSSGEPYMTVLRILGYAFVLGALAHLIVDKLAKYRQIADLAEKTRPRQG